jgi:ketosteroid isomerase-like protein
MEMRRATSLAAVLVAALAMAEALSAEPLEALASRVRVRETAFAKTMADRDHSAFATFVAEEALFLGRSVLRGREAVVAGWKAYFEGDEAPFSWQPDRVEVVESGTLAFSTGPVFDPGGKRVGTFNSTWRLEKDGEWRVVLDSGCPPCACP